MHNRSGSAGIFELRGVRLLLDVKTLWLLYFGGGTFLTVGADLLFLRAGSVRTALLWQILLGSLFCALAQVLIYGEKPAEIPPIRRIALHFLLTYAVMLLLAAVFEWMPFTFLSVVIFTGIFILVYAGLFIGFAVLGRIEKNRLNERLNAYKEQRKS